MRAVVLLLAILIATPATAHALRVFARVEIASVSGYGFFIGGGRPRGAAWTARMGATTIASGETDADGGFAFATPAELTGPVSITIDTREGHFASTTLAPERFAAGATAAAARPATATARVAEVSAATAVQDPAETAALVEAAVARQVAPLLERIEVMDSRLRMTDIVSGVVFIFGLAGVGLWAMGRRR